MTELSAICRPVSPELSRTSKLVVSALARAARLSGCPADAVPATAGKMIRPALLLMVARLFGADKDTAVRLAAAVELVHAASLIHDDVIDASGMRRGAPTAFRSIGAADAVLLGDVVFANAFADVASLGSDVITREIAATVRDVCAGEVRQNRAKGTFDSGRAWYLRTAELKTASLYRACAVLPALAAGAARPRVAAAGRFGRNFGLAFQITDDLLDVIGDPRRTGKPNGRDLAQGKTTLPLVIFFETLGSAERRRVRRALREGQAPVRREVLAALGRPAVVTAVRRAAERCRARATADLDRLPDAPEKAHLASLCLFAVNRLY